MSELVHTDIDIEHHGTVLKALLVAPEGASGLPGVLLIHDAFGVGGFILDTARALAREGFAVFCADIWGQRTTPTGHDEVGPLIGGMVSQPTEWMSRVEASHQAALQRPELDPTTLTGLGYCFGGSTVLEYLRSGADLGAGVAIHPGLDLIGFDYAAANVGTDVLVCVGSADPMATAQQRSQLEEALSGAGIDWEVDLYGGAVHAFTNPSGANSPNPQVVAYHPVAAARAWDATLRFLRQDRVPAA